MLSRVAKLISAGPSGRRSAESEEDFRSGEATALIVQNLVCSYGGVQAVRGITFSVNQGEFVGIIGPNGAGKSTLVDCLSGLNRSYRGKVTAWGVDVTRRPIYAVAELGVIRTFQLPRPFAKLSVLSNLMYGPRHQVGESFLGAMFGRWRNQEKEILRQARSGLELLSLSEVADNYGAELSGGQERLIELLRAIMCKPRLLLLDEPFAGVSPANRSVLARELQRMVRSSGVTVVMVEHRLEWVERLCSRILVMAEGQLIAEGSMDDVRKDTRVVEAYLGSPRIKSTATDGSVTSGYIG